MQVLQLVGVHEDGEHLVLATADGQRFRLLVDEPLRAAVRRDRARLGQLQIEVDGAPRPRDIQARIRAGESAEDVARSAGLPIEHVRRFEGPVIAEREHVAQRARRVPVRSGASRGRPLGELVQERLTHRGASDEGTWDAWRREDGLWGVSFAFRAGTKDRRAQWSFDPAAGSVEPLDDEARWLSAAEVTEEGPIPGRRLAAVKERVYDVEADGGVREAAGDRDVADGAPPGAEAPVPAEPDPQDATVDLLDELRGRRGRRQPVLSAQELAAQDDADDALLPPPAHPAPSRPQEAVDDEILALPDASAPDATGADDASVVADEGDGTATQDGAWGATGRDRPSGTEHEPAATPRRHQARSKARRPSVPSWDEIVFGAKKD